MTYVKMNKAENLGGVKAWVAWGFAALFYFYQFIVKVSPSVLTDDLMADFYIDSGQLGEIIAYYYLAYVMMQIPLGSLMDKFGPKRILSFAGFICGAGCYIFASTKDVNIASIGRFLMGAGSACGFLGSLKIATLWFPPKKLALISALTLSLGTIGGITAQAPVSYITSFIGWRATFIGLAWLGVIVGICIVLFVGTHPSIKNKNKESANPKSKLAMEKAEKFKNKNPLWKNLLIVATSPQTWIISLFGLFMYVPLSALAELWNVSFLQLKYGIDERLAATINSTMFIGIALGSPFMARMSDYALSRKLPMMVGSLGCLILFSIAIYMDSLPIAVMYPVMFFAGIFFTAKVLTFASVVEIMPQNMSGVAIGFCNMVVMTSGIIFQRLLGKLITWNWDGTYIEKVVGDSVQKIPNYTLENYKFAFSAVPLCLIAAVILVLMMKETYAHGKTRNRKQRSS